MIDDSPPRLLLIALDAAPPSLVRHWCDDGSLPNLRLLRDSGTSGDVASQADLYPGSVWPTFFTASDVSHHANYHLLQWDASTKRLRPPGGDWCGVTPFWHRLGANGIPAIALDVPFSDTGRTAKNVVEVIGWSMHEGVWSTSRPAGLMGEVNTRHGRADQMREGPGERPAADIAGWLPGLLLDVRRRAAIIEDLATRFPWRLFLAVFSETHRAGHWFWSERSTGVPLQGVKESMKAFDAVLPRLRAILRPQDHLVVFSIHGMGATNDVDRVGEAAVAHLGRAGRRSLALALDPVRTLRDALPQRAVRFVARSLPSQAYRWTYYHLQNARNDLARAKFVINPLDNLVYAHLGPRAADGPLTAKEALLADLQAEFQGIRTVDGSPIVEQAVRPGESLSGPRLGLLPGLIIKPIEQLIGPELIMANGARLQVPRHSSRDGEHTSEGFYIQTGPGVSAGSRGPTISGEQLAAFLLGPAGIPLAAAGAG